MGLEGHMGHGERCTSDTLLGARRLDIQCAGHLYSLRETVRERAREREVRENYSNVILDSGSDWQRGEREEGKKWLAKKWRENLITNVASRGRLFFIYRISTYREPIYSYSNALGDLGLLFPVRILRYMYIAHSLIFSLSISLTLSLTLWQFSLTTLSESDNIQPGVMCVIMCWVILCLTHNYSPSQLLSQVALLDTSLQCSLAFSLSAALYHFFSNNFYIVFQQRHRLCLKWQKNPK